MVDIAMPPPLAAVAPAITPVGAPPAITAPGAAVPATPAAKPKKLTPAETLAEMTRDPAAVKAVGKGKADAQQVTSDMQSLVDEYFKGKEGLVLAYAEANQKTMAARMKAGLPAEGAGDEKALREKLTRSQRRELESAESTEASARKAVEDAMGKAPKSGPDPLAVEKETITKMVTASNAPKVAEAHHALLARVTDELIKEPGGRVFSTVSDRIKAVDKAAKDTTEAGKAALEEAKAELKKAIAKSRISRDLSEKDQQAVLDAIVTNASAAVAVNKKENPVSAGISDMTDSVKATAVAEAKALPNTLLQGALKGTGVDAALNNPLVNLAKRAVTGTGTPG